MEKLEMMYEGKAKKIYATDKADEVIVYYKDDATALSVAYIFFALPSYIISNFSIIDPLLHHFQQ